MSVSWADFNRDICLKDDFEGVAFRFDFNAKRLFKRFYDKDYIQPETLSDFKNGLFYKTVMEGAFEITRQEYDNPKSED